MNLPFDFLQLPKKGQPPPEMIFELFCAACLIVHIVKDRSSKIGRLLGRLLVHLKLHTLVSTPLKIKEDT